MTLSEKGPGGGGWILTNKYLQVVTHPGGVLGMGTIFAVGDCIWGCIERPKVEAERGGATKWELPPVPKTGYTAEEFAVHACVNIRALDKRWYGRWCSCAVSLLHPTWYPWGSGIFSISLGPADACFIV